MNTVTQEMLAADATRTRELMAEYELLNHTAARFEASRFLLADSNFLADEAKRQERAEGLYAVAYVAGFNAVAAGARGFVDPVRREQLDTDPVELARSYKKEADNFARSQKLTEAMMRLRLTDDGVDGPALMRAVIGVENNPPLSKELLPSLLSTGPKHSSDSVLSRLKIPKIARYDVEQFSQNRHITKELPKQNKK